jgi:hypothetical protein
MSSEMNGLAFSPRGLKKGKRNLTEHISALLGSGSTTAAPKHSVTKKITKSLEDIRDVIELMLTTAATAILQTCVAESVITSSQGII